MRLFGNSETRFGNEVLRHNMDETDNQLSQEERLLDDLRDAAKSKDDIYYFESENVALKGNADYQALLNVVARLEGQRIQAVKDLDTLIESKKKALDDPIGFVHKLQHKVDIGLPKRIDVPEVPQINWENYLGSNNPWEYTPKHMTRNKLRVVSEDSAPNSRSQSPVMMKTESGSFVPVVRGRMKDEKKPETFNQLWTAEEQRKLEELLVKYPVEDVESRRWQKIAAALGNRTPLQVASRVQKYFIRLAKEGLPIPGRMPNMNTYKKIDRRLKQYRLPTYAHSTLMTSYAAPVLMKDGGDDDDEYYHEGHHEDGGPMESRDLEGEIEVSDEDDVPDELRHTEMYRQIMKLKKIKRQKLIQDVSSSVTRHHGYKCDRCNCEPIVGTRWHCSDCPEEYAVDFCNNCVDFVFETDTHNSTHRLDPVDKGPSTSSSSAHIDSDYAKLTAGNYNYLDPNFMPGS